MDVGSLWFTQHCLKRSYQIKRMADEMKLGDYFLDPPVVLNVCDDGEVEINDGHHRVVALWLAGVRTLRPHDYRVQYTDNPKRRFWRVVDLKYKTNLLQLEDWPYPC